MLVNVFVPTANHLTEIVWPNDSIDARKHRLTLDGDLAASLTATSGEDGATRTGAHTQTETVNLGAAAVVGLVSTLRHYVLLGLRPAQSG